MSQESWTVKNETGKKLGFVKKLIIDSNTRQIAYADLLLAETGQVVRIPWSLLAVKDHGILLKATKEEIQTALSPVQSEEIPEPVTLEVTMTAPGRIRQGKTATKPHAPPPTTPFTSSSSH